MKDIVYPHRDDLPFDVAEKIIEQAKAAMAEKFPDRDFSEFKFIFAGDAPTNDPNTVEMIQKFEAARREMDVKFEKSKMFGLCIDCDEQMPTYPSVDVPFPEDWHPYEGWGWFAADAVGGEQYFMGWQCPACHALGPRTELPNESGIGFVDIALPPREQESCRETFDDPQDL